MSIAQAECAGPIVEILKSGQLSALGEEYAASVLASISAAVSGVGDATRAGNHETIFTAGGIAPLVRLLRTGSHGAKRHAAAALTQLSCDLEEDDGEEAVEAVAA